MKGMTVHLIKMSAGTQSLDQLANWQNSVARREAKYGTHVVRHWTKHRPKRAAEIEGVASIFWIFKGAIRARQPILALEAVEFSDEDGNPLKKCAIVLDATRLIPTEPQPRRPHQGWRYFDPEDAPLDLNAGDGSVDPEMPLDMRAELASLGLL